MRARTLADTVDVPNQVVLEVARGLQKPRGARDAEPDRIESAFRRFDAGDPNLKVNDSTECM
jgi:hypothetical protein